MFNLGNNGQKTYLQKQEDKNLLLAYTSGDKQVNMMSDFQGDNTRKRLNQGNQIILDQIEQYKTGLLLNVDNMRIDEQSDESAIYCGNMLLNSQNVK